MRTTFFCSTQPPAAGAYRYVAAQIGQALAHTFILPHQSDRRMRIARFCRTNRQGADTIYFPVQCLLTIHFHYQTKNNHAKENAS